MPVPRVVAKANRYLLNPVIRRIAGRIPPLAILIHRGRKSGTEYRTPIMVFPDGNDFVIALTYGPDTDWERNIRASGACDLIYRGRTHHLVDPHAIPAREANESLPWLVRNALPLLHVDQFLRLVAASRRIGRSHAHSASNNAGCGSSQGALR